MERKTKKINIIICKKKCNIFKYDKFSIHVLMHNSTNRNPDVIIFEQKMFNSRSFSTLAITKKYGNNEKYRFGIIAKETIEMY